MKKVLSQGRLKQTSDNSLSKTFLIVTATALLIGVLHSQHLYHLFENDRFFSALSSLERDLSFRTEMGLYYSYYKTVVTSDTFSNGINALLYDNITEYPSTINTLERFNLYPEVVLGGSFRLVSRLLKILEVKSDCYGIQRGQNQPPITTCKGLGEPHYFYIYSIFGLNAFLPVSIFFLSLYLSDSLLGGIISVLMFFYNHGEATRVMWTPPLRESFAMPFLFLQLLVLTHILKIHSVKFIHYILYGLTSLLFLLPWQFSQFVLLTQVSSLNWLTSTVNAVLGPEITSFLQNFPNSEFLCIVWVIPYHLAIALIYVVDRSVLSLQAIYSMRLLRRRKFICLLITLALMVLLNAVLQFGNIMLLTSYFAFIIPASLCVVTLGTIFNQLRWLPLITLSEFLFCILLSLGLKSFVTAFFGLNDDAHIGAILLSKFTTYQDFHTQLYTCAAEFDFLSISYLGKLTSTLLIPASSIVIINICWQSFLFLFFGNHTTDTAQVNKEQVMGKHGGANKLTPEYKQIQVEPELISDKLEVTHVYHTLQCVAFAVMAILIMRLKLFLTPLLAIIAGLVTSRKILKKLSGHHRVSITYGLLVVSSVGGLWNLSDQMNIIGEYNNPDLEGLVDWINTTTPHNASFAGSMPVMATVKLTTGRPIVNHPHYEDSGLRARTKLVYTIYSKRDSEIIYHNLRSLLVQYVIIEDIWCNKQYRKGCAFHDIYLMDYPDDRDNPVFCLMVKMKALPENFKLVFRNKSYKVLQLVSNEK